MNDVMEVEQASSDNRTCIYVLSLVEHSDLNGVANLHCLKMDGVEIFGEDALFALLDVIRRIPRAPHVLAQTFLIPDEVQELIARGFANIRGISGIGIINYNKMRTVADVAREWIESQGKLVAEGILYGGTYLRRIGWKPMDRFFADLAETEHP